MLPSYPSLTFPNHFTIVTGLYPEHHGIVANSFLDPARSARYSMYDTQTTNDGSWYGGVPLWSLAESQGMRTACLFGSRAEAKIAGFRPSYYAHLTMAKPSPHPSPSRRASTMRSRCSICPPPTVRISSPSTSPSPTTTGHEFGPDAPRDPRRRAQDGRNRRQTRAALNTTGLPIDLVVVSDHGMVKIGRRLDQPRSVRRSLRLRTVGALLYGKTEEDRDRVYNQLKHVSSQFIVYRRKDVPAGLNYNQNPREGDPIIVATGPFAIRAHAPCCR